MKKQIRIIEGNWYAPEKYLQSKKSIVHASLLEMSSSAGNWSGIFIKKIGKKYQVFSFYQENHYSGFRLYIGEKLFETRKELTVNRLEAVERLACNILFN